MGDSEPNNGGARIAGDAAALSKLVDCLDRFALWFPIATHDWKSGEG
ncbi:MAG: hypothetical protein ACR2RL_09420 [Gammaproteobacteria bacterium]